MKIQTFVAQDKARYPERFCKAPRCLWRVVKLDHETQTYSLRPDCPGGRCPKHQLHAKQFEVKDIGNDIPEEFQRKRLAALLAQYTEEQRRIFDRMHPDRIDQKQLISAIIEAEFIVWAKL